VSTNFELAVANVLQHEGGFVNNKHDPGGATNYGISLRWLADVDLSDADIDRDGDVDADDIKAMTEADAKNFYRKYWWNKFDYGLIINAEVAIKVMDMSVNMGGKQAHKLAQRALRAVGVVVEDDGVLGPLSVAAINSATPTFYIPALRCTQAGFYYALVMRNAALRKAGVVRPNGTQYQNFSVFLKGWLNRAYS